MGMIELEIVPPAQWRKIKTDMVARNGWYEVSDQGDVRHRFKKTFRNLTAFRRKPRGGMHGSDYYAVKIAGQEKRVHLLVWEAFCGPVPEGHRVIHRNGLKEDNSLANLMLCDLKTIGKRYGRLGRKRPAVAWVDANGDVLEIFRSAREAARHYPLSYGAILDRCNGDIKNSVLPDGTDFKWDTEALFGKCGRRKKIQEHGSDEK